MKKISLIALSVFLILCYAATSFAAPRLQTYIWRSSYQSDALPGEGTWVTSNDNFLVTTAAYWQKFEIGDSYISRPVTDHMDCYLRIGVPRGETGSIFINGVSINLQASAPPPALSTLSLEDIDPGAVDYHYIRVGKMSNNYVDALHFDHGVIHEPGWGSMRVTHVSVSGYSSVHFDAAGFDTHGISYMSPGSYDSRYNTSYSAAPEPGTLSLLGAGLLVAAPFIRRRISR